MTRSEPPRGGTEGNVPTRPVPAQAPLPDPAPGPTAPPMPSDDAEAPSTVRRSRLGGLWVGLIASAVVLVLLLVFILQNSQGVQITYFGFSGRAPLAVAILLGVAAGVLLVALPGSVRILQLRRSIRRK